MKTMLELELTGSTYKSVLPQHPVPKFLPEKMKGWVTYRGGKTSLEEIDIPVMMPEDVLVEPLWISVCSSDVNKFVSLVDGLNNTIFGHEFAGRIVAVGNKVNKNLIGETVVVEEHYPCLRCDQCIRGHFDRCTNFGFLGWHKSGNPNDRVRNGAFADYVSVHYSCAKPTRGLEKLDFFPSLAEPFGNAVKMARVVEETCSGIPEVLAFWGGCGFQAMNMVPYFSTLGVNEFVLLYRGTSAMRYMKNYLKDIDASVHIVKSDDTQTIQALKNDLTGGDGFISIELTGNQQVQERVINYAAPKGAVFYYGLPGAGKKVMIPGTSMDITSFVTGKSGTESLKLPDGPKAVRVMGRDRVSWEKTMEVLLSGDFLRKKLMTPLIMAGTTKNIGKLVQYLISNGLKYPEKPFGPRPAKFAVLSDKLTS